MFEIIKQLHDLAPMLMDLIATLVTLCTVLQGIALFVGKFWAPAQRIAHYLGIAALDMHKAAEGTKAAIGAARGKPAEAEPRQHITIPPKGDS